MENKIFNNKLIYFLLMKKKKNIYIYYLYNRIFIYLKLLILEILVPKFEKYFLEYN